MKKAILTLELISALILFYNISFAFIETPQRRFGPEAILKPIELSESFGKPKDMINIIPNRPVAARDKYGNRLYFTPNGKLTLKINTNGSLAFSLDNFSKEKDKDGNLQRITEKQQGNNIIVIKNENGEILGYQELGLGGKVIKEYDKDMALIKSYHYNKYGKITEFVLDELSQTKTIFNKKEQPLYDIDFENNKVAFYTYDQNTNKLLYKEDVYGNKTYFDTKGNLTHTEDINGNIRLKYYYKKDEEGNTVLDKVEETETKNVTFYKNGKQIYTLNKEGAKIKEYHWIGSKLVFSFDYTNQETTYYDLNGKPIYTTYNEFKIKEWLYFKGRLVGFYDEHTRSTLIYKYQREDIKLYTEAKPTAEQIQKWYDEGLIDKMRIIQ